MEKLLRPLHRQRQRRRSKFQVLNRAELATLLDVPTPAVEAHLDELGIAYHADSNGEIWASINPQAIPRE
ncbi:MAG: hypothetical protein AAF529_24330 [Pseudomonadota bacterium]